MDIEKMSNNLLQVNTYFLIDNEKCLLIDPGSNHKKIIDIINKKYLNLVGIVLTHAHFDHFIACNTLNETFNVPLYVHKLSVPSLYDPNLNISGFFSAIQNLILNKNIEVIEINEQTKNIETFNVDIFHTPGHSPGSISLYFKNEKAVFSGDALFKNSIGRTDFINCDEKKLIKNIKNKLFKLPDDTIVYPGHGEKTTIGFEKKHNYLIR